MENLSLYIILYYSKERIIITFGGIDMDYMTLKEASEKWGVTPRWINYYCSAGCIPGAVKMGTVWLIPKSAQKPKDGRRKENKHE